MPDDDRVAAVPEERCAVELRLRDVLAGQVGRDRGVPERLEFAHDVGEAPPAVPGSVHENESRHRREYPNPERETSVTRGLVLQVDLWSLLNDLAVDCSPVCATPSSVLVWGSRH